MDILQMTRTQERLIDKYVDHFSDRSDVNHFVGYLFEDDVKSLNLMNNDQGHGTIHLRITYTDGWMPRSFNVYITPHGGQSAYQIDVVDGEVVTTHYTKFEKIVTYCTI